MWRFLPLISLPASKPCGSIDSPLFGALYALAVDDAGGRARLARGLLAASHIERMMDVLQRSVPVPAAEIAVDRAARRQVLRDVAPLTAGAQHIHHAVDHLAHVDSSLAATSFGRRDQRLDQRPFGVGEIAGIAQPVAVVAMAVLDRPHRRTSRICADTESQPIEPVQAIPAPAANRFK